MFDIIFGMLSLFLGGMIALIPSIKLHVVCYVIAIISFMHPISGGCAALFIVSNLIGHKAIMDLRQMSGACGK